MKDRDAENVDAVAEREGVDADEARARLDATARGEDVDIETATGSDPRANRDRIDEALEDSFPASDPPSTSGTT